MQATNSSILEKDHSREYSPDNRGPLSDAEYIYRCEHIKKNLEKRRGEETKMRGHHDWGNDPAIASNTQY